MSNDANQIEFSFKKLMGFRMTDAQKAWYNENAGVLLNAHASEVWMDDIPGTPPATTTSVIEVYNTLTLTEDSSVAGKMAWLCKTGGVQLTGFIPPRFGQGYFVRVFDNNLNEILTADASVWTFDYDNGVLWFENTPLTYGHAMPIKIRVYRYVGTTLDESGGSGGTTLRFVANGPYRPTIALDGAFAIDVATSITSIYLSRRIPGTANSTVLDVNVNGASLYITQSNRPTIQYSDADGIVLCTLPDIVTIAAGDVLTVDIDSRESGRPEDLTLIITLV